MIVMNFLANRIRTNIRRLEGALIRVASYAALTGKRVSLEVVESLLRELLHEEGRFSISMEVIQKRVAEHFDDAAGRVLAVGHDEVGARGADQGRKALLEGRVLDEEHNALGRGADTRKTDENSQHSGGASGTGGVGGTGGSVQLLGQQRRPLRLRRHPHRDRLSA